MKLNILNCFWFGVNFIFILFLGALQVEEGRMDHH